MAKYSISLIVNGKRHEGNVEARLLPVHFLWDHLRLSGTHIGRYTGKCGACAVRLGGEAVKSCTLVAVQANGAEPTTIEGIASGERLHRIQEGFQAEHGKQYGA